ncbi:hypothetical protein E2C01_073420 [Portunus trituberculatus]|uniref:Uncharacterized protein n=1 Tax=Portunus trituberculatus TaxID=210409 RepID=A0A5B7I9E5_PORTR|nr:hypothetical protein [Portunus trituberculatus]
MKEREQRRRSRRKLWRWSKRKRVKDVAKEEEEEEEEEEGSVRGCSRVWIHTSISTVCGRTRGRRRESHAPSRDTRDEDVGSLSGTH